MAWKRETDAFTFGLLTSVSSAVYSFKSIEMRSYIFLLSLMSIIMISCVSDTRDEVVQETYMKSEDALEMTYAKSQIDSTSTGEEPRKDRQQWRQLPPENTENEKYANEE